MTWNDWDRVCRPSAKGPQDSITSQLLTLGDTQGWMLMPEPDIAVWQDMSLET
eukprot:CAMPEP_0194510360 /NCGR_PEP_ID=MMETSP0253-20130528/41663_1 /TAXON_ID=2966 /ORGANISM="Noctiluca scintillans" /LENGTH=52 /DNA_ID=CAMNT_0039353589 /DNA_START=380 /DNA_END=538 /DNA_ORIENTATION=+